MTCTYVYSTSYRTKLHECVVLHCTCTCIYLEEQLILKAVHQKIQDKSGLALDVLNSTQYNYAEATCNNKIICMYIHVHMCILYVL